MYIKFSKQAVKVLSRMDAAAKQRLRQAILTLPEGDVKQLNGSNQLYRLRVGKYRVVFSYPNVQTILIEKIAPRGDVYKGGLL